MEKLNMMNKTILFIISIVFYSCDPESCRHCETFNFDISEWSIMDDTIKSSYRFFDESENEYLFEFKELQMSEPYKECQISSSEDGVGCLLTKKITYEADFLNYDFRIFYEQFEVPGNNPALNNCYYLIEVQGKQNDFHCLSPPLDLFTVVDMVKGLEPVESYAFAGQSYSNVLRMRIDSMIVFDTYVTIDVKYVEPKIKEVMLQSPNGIIGLTLDNDKRLILKE